MDSPVRTRDSTGRHYSALGGPLWPTTGPTGQALGARNGRTEAHKIGKAERTPMAHTERAGIGIG